MKVQGILVATVCLLLCFTGCAVPGQTETTSSGESHSAESTAPLDDADFQQESAGFAPTDQMTEPFTGVDTKGYSLWGGSAGARMAAWLGSYGPAAFGGDDLPQPSAVIMQYTGHSDYTENDPPTFACVGEGDGIANWRTMERRLTAMSILGIPTEFHHYPGLPHGFGLGTGTVAEGWLDEAVTFWKAQM